MTVKELIKILRKYPSDDDVLVDGYEFGMCDLKENGIVSIRYNKNVYDCYYAGPHKADENGEFLGLLLTRTE